MIKAPGPLGHYLHGHAREFEADPLHFLLTQQQQYGDFFRFRLGLKPVFVLSRLDHIQAILSSSHFKDKTPDARMAANYTQSVARIEGDEHLARRRLLAPAFSWDALNQTGTTLADICARHCANWQNGEARPFARDMKALVFDSLIRLLLGPCSMEQVAQLAQVVPLIEAWLGSREMEEAQFLQARAQLHTLLLDIAQDQAGPGASGPNLLSCLRQAIASGAIDQDGMVDEIAMMLMTTIPTANALSWQWYYLASQPEVWQHASALVQQVVGQQPVSSHHFGALRYLDHVAAETLRLHPPVWTLAREAKQDWPIDQWTIPAGAEVLISPWLIHRLPQYWREPEQFAPQRFESDAHWFQERPRLAWLPFGAGSRKCIGERLTRLIMVLLSASLLQRFRPALAPGFVVNPNGVTPMRPGDGAPDHAGMQFWHSHPAPPALKTV
ncbi:MAG: hypothetical protein RL748_493 [Pseudomonadota bacterium]|jgi:cytochrome P450